MNFKNKCYLMGILNITTDSFFDGNKYFEKNKAIEHGLKMVEDGADIIDIGGESTKPNAIKVSPDEEINRLIDIICSIKKYKNICVSVDTYKSQVAKEVLENGADIINDVYGGLYDENMFELVKKYDSHICITHNRLDNINKFSNVVEETYNELNIRYNEALNQGVKKEKIILDPGLGFSKYGYNNVLLIQNISKFKEFNIPLLVGISRKKFLNLLDGIDPLYSNKSTISVNAYMASLGINILRVHDVKEHKKIIDVINSIVYGGISIE